MDILFTLIRAPQVASMFLPGFLVGFFFGALCYRRPSLIVDVVTAGFALVPIWIVGASLFLRDLQVALISALFLFLSLGVGFLLIGFAAGAGIAFILVRIATREKPAPSGG
jgi:hypothetical protein